MNRCIYKELLSDSELEQYNNLKNAFGYPEAILNAKIGAWQELHFNTEDFPTIEQLGQYIRDTSSTYTQEMQEIKNNAINNGTFMKAPNGKPTNLNERQWLTVRTDAFKNWFGDWENDSANASKVVDENGEPLVVYHGGAKGINIFRAGGSNTGEGYYENTKTGEKIEADSANAMFFSDNPYVAYSYQTLYGIMHFHDLYNRVQSMIETTADGKFHFKEGMFSDINNLYNILDELSEYNDRFIKFKEYIQNVKDKYGKITPYLTKKEVSAFRDMLINIREEVDAHGFEWTMNTSGWFNDFKTSRSIINRYNNKDGIRKLLNGEIPSEIEKEWEIYKKIENQREKEGLDKIGNYKELVLWIGTSDSFSVGNYRFVYDGTNLLLDHTSLSDDKRMVPITKMSEKEISDFFNNALIIQKSDIAKRKNASNFKKVISKGNTYAVFLNIKNPLIHDYEGTHQGQGYKQSQKNSFGYIAARQVKKAIQEGNDGVIYENLYDPYLATNYGVLNPNQVKSATDNVEFSKKTNNIYESKQDNTIRSDFDHAGRPLIPSAYQNMVDSLVNNPNIRKKGASLKKQWDDFVDDYYSKYKIRIIGTQSNGKYKVKEVIDERPIAKTSDEFLDYKFGYNRQIKLGDLIKNLKSTSGTLSGLMDILLDVLGDLKNMNVRIGSIKEFEGKDSSAFYDVYRNEIVVNPHGNFYGKNGSVNSTILHEAIHAIIANAKITEEQLGKLNDIYNEAVEALTKKYGKTKDELLNDRKFYGLTNVDEFVSEMFTNHGFVNELNSIGDKVHAQLTLFDKFINWVMSVIGVPSEIYFDAVSVVQDIMLNYDGKISSEREMISDAIEFNSAPATKISTPNNPIQIYSDGSDIKGTGAIGYGSVFELNGKMYGISGTEASEEVRHLQELFPDAKFSNPTMEMLALATTLEQFANQGNGEHLVINQDYKGAVNYGELWNHSEGSNQRDGKPWKAKEKYIAHLVDRATAAINKIEQDGGSVKILWVKGHQTAKTEAARMNDAADSYAKSREVFNTINNAYSTEIESIPTPQESNTMPVTKIISGGQTGVDTIGLQVAKSLGIETGGTAPKRFLRENNVDTEDIQTYGLKEITDEEQADYTSRTGKKDSYTGRTELNVRNSDGTVYFSTAEDNAGLIATKRAATEWHKPFLENPTAQELREWLVANNIKTLNVAGNRGSKLKDPDKVASILREALTTSDVQQNIPSDSEPVQNTTQEESAPANVDTQNANVDSDMNRQMHRIWTPKQISHKAYRIAKIFSDVVTELENKLPLNEKSKTSFQTRQYIISQKYGTANILGEVQNRIRNTFCNKEWVDNYIADVFGEEVRGTEQADRLADKIIQQGQLMIQYFSPLCIYASDIVKQNEAIQILSKDGEIIVLDEIEKIQDESTMTKHEEGWFVNNHEQSADEVLDREIKQMLMNIYEYDSDGDFVQRDDMLQPIPIDYKYVLATLLNVVSKCTIDSQMIPKLKSAVKKFPWIQQVLDMLCGRDTQSSMLYENLSEEERLRKTMSLQAKFFTGLHKIYVNIAVQDVSVSKNGVATVNCKIVNKQEGQQALDKSFQDTCYGCRKLFNEDNKPFKTVYNADGTFDIETYKALHAELMRSELYNRLYLQSESITDDDIALIEKLLKSFGCDISQDMIRSVIFANATDGNKHKAEKAVIDLRDALTGKFYKANIDQNEPLKDVLHPTTPINVYDAFRVAYDVISEIFGDYTQGYEESSTHVNVDNENQKLFSHILPNMIHTIFNKLCNIDNLSEENYKKRMDRDYFGNWWFSPTKGKHFGWLKNLYEKANWRSGIRLKTLKASKEISYKKEIDAQAEETRLNEFEHTKREIGGEAFRDYSVPSFSDKSESYYCAGRYYDVNKVDKNGKHSEFSELIDNLCDVFRQELNRIDVVNRRAAILQGKNGIASFDIQYKDGARIESKEDGSNFHFFYYLNDGINIDGVQYSKDEIINKINELANDPVEQDKFIHKVVKTELEKEFDFYISHFNACGVSRMPESQHREDFASRNRLMNILFEMNKDAQSSRINQILYAFENDVMTQSTFNALKMEAMYILSGATNAEELNTAIATNPSIAEINRIGLDTKLLSRLADYFYNTFYAQTQIIELTMRDPAFLSTPTKFQKRMAMYYTPIATCYTSHYIYDEDGNLILRSNEEEGSLAKSIEYSITLQDDKITQAASYDNLKSALDKRVSDGYLNAEQRDIILDNMKGINRADAQCFRTLPSWQTCLNMIGESSNERAQNAINKLTNPEKYGEWTYEDYYVVWEIFKPMVCSYQQVDSHLNDENIADFNSQYDKIEVPVFHKNSEFLLLAMYSALSGVQKESPKLVGLNRFMVAHGIDKAQFESAVKVGGQNPININNCETEEEVIAVLEQATGLTGTMSAKEGNQDVIHSIPFRDWGISTSMPEHLLSHDESPLGTQFMKIVMEGMVHNPNGIVKVGNTTYTYAGWIKLYQAIFTQNLKDAFKSVSEELTNSKKLADYLKKKILNQNSYSHDLIKHLELDDQGNFVNPIIDPMLRKQFDSLCAALIRNEITKRPFKLGALPQVASWGHDDLQMRFEDENGNLILTESEFENATKEAPYIINVKDRKTGEIEQMKFTEWTEYRKYADKHSNTLAYVEVLIPPFDNNFLKDANDIFIYKEDTVDKNGVKHKSGEFIFELLNKKLGKNRKLLNGIGYRVPVETKHSMVPFYVKGFLPSQNSSCIVCPPEWIAISDSDNDGDKLYSLFYESKIVWDYKRMKVEAAKKMSPNYNYSYIGSRDKTGEYKKGDKTYFITEGTDENRRFDALWEQALNNQGSDPEVQILRDYIAECKKHEEYLIAIEPVKYNIGEDIKRRAGESQEDFNLRRDMESIKSNGLAARNNKLLDMMIGALRTEENSAQILIPGGFPIAKKVASEMKKLMHINDDACSICNPAMRTIHQVRNMAGRTLIGVYANHRSFRPYLEQSGMSVKPKYHITINGNESLPKDSDGNPSWSLCALKNARGEFISDNIANFSGAAVDNAKEPLLSYLGQNINTASVSMYLIHCGYTIEEVAVFMNQPIIVDLIKEYLMQQGTKDYMPLSTMISEWLKKFSRTKDGIRYNSKEVQELSLDLLKDQISKGPRIEVQYKVLEVFQKAYIANGYMSDIINVTKVDTQVGGIKSSSAENQSIIQTIKKVQNDATSQEYPFENVENLVSVLRNEEDIESSAMPMISAFRYYTIDNIPKIFKNISLTFNALTESVLERARGSAIYGSVSAKSIDEITDAVASYCFSALPMFKGNRRETIKSIVDVVKEIKAKKLIKGNVLIDDLIANSIGNKYSKGVSTLEIPESKRRNKGVTENYRIAWDSLFAEGDEKIILSGNKYVTHAELGRMLMTYCFMVNGLNQSSNSFISAFPEERINEITGYNKVLKSLQNAKGQSETSYYIFNQYIANHPYNQEFAHRIDAQVFSEILEKSKIVPSEISVRQKSNFVDSFYKADKYGNRENMTAYNYIYVIDKSGRQYLYKALGEQGDVTFVRCSVLGNTRNGYLEEYEMNKDIFYNSENSIQSSITANRPAIIGASAMTSINNQLKAASQTGEQSENLSIDVQRNIIQQIVGENVTVDINIENYKTIDKDATGIDFCAII